MTNPITGFGLAQGPEGLWVTIRYATVDDSGNLVSNNQQQSYIESDPDVLSMYEALKTKAAARIGG